MDNSNVFHSDYLLKLHYIGQQIGDEKFERVLDRILAESNVHHVPPKPIDSRFDKSQHSSNASLT